MRKNSVPLHPVISFSVINYVVSMRRPRASGEVSFLFYTGLIPHDRKLESQTSLFAVGHLDLSSMEIHSISYNRQSES